MVERNVEEKNEKGLSLSIKKIVVIGPESTGKSTLSEALAASLHTAWVPEFARTYLDQLNRDYEENDLLAIAKGQIKSEEEQLEKANKLLICDTDLNVLKVWAEHKYKRCDKWILEQIAERKYDLYLLTYIDIPWQEDPLREHPEKDMREYFFNQYQDIVMNSGLPFVVIKGTHEERLSTALKTIKALIQNS